MHYDCRKRVIVRCDVLRKAAGGEQTQSGNSGPDHLSSGNNLRSRETPRAPFLLLALEMWQGIFQRSAPHSDGAGIVDLVGDGVSANLHGQRVWCFGAQSYRPFGTAAEFTVVPGSQAIALPDDVSFEQGACLGIPAITAHRCVHASGPVDGRTVLVQGGGGAVGMCAVHLARRAGAFVLATVRSSLDEPIARAAGAHHVLQQGPDLIRAGSSSRAGRRPPHRRGGVRGKHRDGSRAAGRSGFSGDLRHRRGQSRDSFLATALQEPPRGLPRRRRLRGVRQGGSRPSGQRGARVGMGRNADRRAVSTRRDRCRPRTSGSTTPPRPCDRDPVGAVRTLTVTSASSTSGRVE